MSAFVGIDLGTTVLKVFAFDAASGRALGGESIRLPSGDVAEGRRELDPGAILECTRRAFVALDARIEGGLRGVEGVGVASQGGSTVVVERSTGRALTPLILWNDDRHRELMPRIAGTRDEGYWRERTFRAAPGYGLARMLWMLESSPRVLAPGRVWSGAGEFLFHHLTGTWRQDAGHAVQVGCYDVANRALDVSLLGVVEEAYRARDGSAVELPRDLLPPMREGHARAPLSGDVALELGLREGTPVAGPYMDHEAGMLSAAGTSTRPLQCSLGTAWVGNAIVPRDAQWSSPSQLVIPSPLDDGWQIVQPLRTGNPAWDWALSAFVDADRETAGAKLDGIFAAGLLPPRGAACLPWVAGSPAFIRGGDGAGAFSGLGPDADPRDMLRALAAGMCYELFRVFERAFAAGWFDAIVVGGGTSRARAHRRILGALFDGVPVRRVKDPDAAGARGALYAFGPALAGGELADEPPADGATRDGVAEGYRAHLAAYERLAANVEASSPIIPGGNPT